MNKLTLSLLVLLSVQFIAVGQTITPSPTPAADASLSKPPLGGKPPQDESDEIQEVILKKITAVQVTSALSEAFSSSKPPGDGKPPQDESEELQTVTLKKVTAVELNNALITALGGSKPPAGGKPPQDGSEEGKTVILKRLIAVELHNALITALGSSKPPGGGKPPQNGPEEIQTVILRKVTAVELYNALITALAGVGGDVPEVTPSNSPSSRNRGGSVRRTPAVAQTALPTFEQSSAQTFAGDIECRAWLDAQKTALKRVVRIIPVRDGTSVFMLERTKAGERFQYTVLPINEAPNEEALLTRIRQNADKTFVGIHKLGATSYLMVFYGR